MPEAADKLREISGEWLRALRDGHRKMSAKQLGEAAHIDPQQIYRFERGRAVPSPEEVERLATVFGVSAAALWPDGAETVAQMRYQLGEGLFALSPLLEISERAIIRIPLDDRWPGAPRFAAVARNKSHEPIIPEGGMAIAVKAQARLEPQQLYLVARRLEDLTEVTVRRFRAADGVFVTISDRRSEVDASNVEVIGHVIAIIAKT